MTTSAIGFIGIVYNKGKAYDHVTLRMHRGWGTPECFKSGDPVVDYYTAGAVFHFRAGPDAIVMGSSSLDDVLEPQHPTQAQIDTALAAAQAYLIHRGELAPKAVS